MDAILEEKISLYLELKRQIQELEAQKKVISLQIMECMPKDCHRIDLAAYWVKKTSIFSIKTSLLHAKQLGAVKIEEVLDKEKLKELYRSGQNPPDVSETQYIQVYSKKLYG